MKRLRAVFRGSVQGVGFRYTVERLARHFSVTGFVKNLRSGQVELVAEGDVDVLKDFLAAVREGDLKDYIRDVDTDWPSATGEFNAFQVHF